MSICEKMNARQMVDKLFEINPALYEQMLDAISDSFENASGTWESDEDGNMILLAYVE